MRRTLLAFAGAAALCASTGTVLAAEHPDHARGKAKQSAAQTCKALRAELGRDAFRRLYGTNGTKAGAFGRCVARTKGTTEQERSDVLNAARACRDEWRADAAAFAQKYGTNANRRNAFGKCVSAKARS